MSWFVRLAHDGMDLYPRLRERFEDPGTTRTRRCAARCSGSSDTS
ncbi:MAG: hypothetical protein R3C32_09890 [Chloroflexota bacterium]